MPKVSEILLYVPPPSTDFNLDFFFTVINNNYVYSSFSQFCEFSSKSYVVLSALYLCSALEFTFRILFDLQSQVSSAVAIHI